jgi:hypothetical protein
MKTFTLLAVTGGLFLSSLCIDGKNVRHVSNACVKSYVRQCVKKCCNNTKKAKVAHANISAKAGHVRS